MYITQNVKPNVLIKSGFKHGQRTGTKLVGDESYQCATR